MVLGKAQRVATDIGEFSSLYFQNMRWFHYTPSNPWGKEGVHLETFDALLRVGHTVTGHRFHSMEDLLNVDGIGMSWRNSSAEQLDWDDVRDNADENLSSFRCKRTASAPHIEGKEKDGSAFDDGIVTPDCLESIVHRLVNLIDMCVERLRGMGSTANTHRYHTPDDIFEHTKSLSARTSYSSTMADL